MVESTVKPSTEVVVSLTEKVPMQVLHVDDDASFLKVAKQCLKMQGRLQVETAVSVEEAMEKMKEKTFDAIVSDYVMPEKDGLEFLKELRDSGNSIPFIMFTGKGREEVAIRALNLGADQYLNKTGDPETVYGELAYGMRKIVKAKRDEERVRESEEKYRSLFENARDVTLTLDLKGKITSINKAAEEYGFRKDKIIEKNMLKFTPKKYWPRLLKELAQIARGKSVEGNIEIITPKGKKTAEYNSNPIIINSRVVGVQAILKDVTERKKAEEALRDANEKWVSLTENTDDVIMILDCKGTIQDLNPTPLTANPREAIGKSVYEYVPREQHNIMMESLKRVFKTGKPDSYEVSPNIQGIDTMWFSTKVVPIKHDRKTVSVILISTDITKRKKAEESLKVTLKKVQILNEKLGVVGRLTRHDVRNKLSAVTGNVYLAKQKLTDDHDALKYLREIDSALQQIERILYFASTYEKLGAEELTYLDVEKSLEEATYHPQT